MPRPDLNQVAAGTLLISDFHATLDATRATGVVWNHDRGNGATGMNELFGDGHVRWAPASGKWTCWDQDTSSHYYWWALDWP